MPFLTQPSQFILAWDRHQICWLACPGTISVVDVETYKIYCLHGEAVMKRDYSMLFCFEGVPSAVKVQDPGDVAGDVLDARGGPLPLRHDVPQQDSRGRCHTVLSRAPVTSRTPGLSLSLH